MHDPLRRAAERMTARYLGVLGLSAVSACALVQSCGGSREQSGGNTTVTMVPNGAGGATGAGATGTSATSTTSTAGSGPTRPLPTQEPCNMCGVTCAVPTAPAPPPLYPAPYETCAPDDGSGGLFSVGTTDSQRRTQPGVCCYLNPSRVPPLGRPLHRRAGGAVLAAAVVRGEWAAG